jgi:hypothetical protein
MNYSTELRNNLQSLLFVRDIKSLSYVTYSVKPEFEELARQTWAVHGVCLNCKRQSITCGRCPECAIKYSELRGWNSEKAVQTQLELAARALRKS